MKKIYASTLFLCIATFSFSQINVGMISQYYFCGNANDVVGPNNGIVRGATLAPDRFGNPNAAYCFNGINNLINLGTTNSLKTQTMSISLWAKITSYTNTALAYANQPFITTRSNSATSNFEAYFMGIYMSTNKIDAATTSSTNVQNSILSNITASIGVWNHVVYMFRQDTTFLYINGVFQQKVFKGFNSGYLLGDSVTLGYVGEPTLSKYSFLNGCLDDIRIYNRQLTPSEINELYTEPNTQPTVTAVSNSSVLCTGQSATLTASGASTYTWNPGGTGMSISISPAVTTTYVVTGTASNGCSNTSTLTQVVSSCLGFAINSNSISETKIYPNPFNNKLIITPNAVKQPVNIYNSVGSLVYNILIENEKTEIDFTLQPSGIYFVRIGSETKKVIKE